MDPKGKPQKSSFYIGAAIFSVIFLFQASKKVLLAQWPGLYPPSLLVTGPLKMTFFCSFPKKKFKIIKRSVMKYMYVIKYAQKRPSYQYLYKKVHQICQKSLNVCLPFTHFLSGAYSRGGGHGESTFLQIFCQVPPDD